MTRSEFAQQLGISKLSVSPWGKATARTGDSFVGEIYNNVL